MVVLIGGTSLPPPASWAAAIARGCGWRSPGGLAETVQQFEMDTGSLPATLEQLVVEPGGAVGWLGPYARPSELRDPWNTPFEYRVPGDGRPFDIVSYGADRKPGGTSVDADIRYE